MKQKTVGWSQNLNSRAGSWGGWGEQEAPFLACQFFLLLVPPLQALYPVCPLLSEALPDRC